MRPSSGRQGRRAGALLAAAIFAVGTLVASAPGAAGKAGDGRADDVRRVL